MSRCLALFLLLSNFYWLSACGLKGDVKPPKDADPAYPRTYPFIP